MCACAAPRAPPSPMIGAGRGALRQACYAVPISVCKGPRDAERMQCAVYRRSRSSAACFSCWRATAAGNLARSSVSEGVLTEFETQHRIRLPGDYRAYLSGLGNGGPGPFYGIFPLGVFDGAGDRDVAWAENSAFVGVLAEPFPHREAWNLPAERSLRPEHFASTTEETAWLSQLDAEYWRPGLVNGAFPICHHGCAMRTYLVVEGPETGNVWLDDRASDGGLMPHVDSAGRHMTFAAWYLQWLSDCRRKSDGISGAR
jgi:hypothetical protein